MNEEIHTKRKGFSQFMAEKDRFGETFQFKLPGNHKKYGSTLGFGFTIALIIFILIQTYLKFQLVFGYGDSVTFESIKNSYYNSSYVLSSNDGLQFAFGITAYDSNQEVVEDLDYGEIKARFYGWGLDDVMGPDQGGDLDTHQCSEQELGLEGSNSLFYPLNKKSKRDISFYKKKLKCSNDFV